VVSKELTIKNQLENKTNLEKEIGKRLEKIRNKEIRKNLHLSHGSTLFPM